MNKRPAPRSLWRSGGFFSIEIVIASAIITLVLGGVISAFALADNSSAKQAIKLAAITRAEAILEELKNHPLTIATTTEITASDLWHFNLTTSMIGNYHLQADITSGFTGSSFKPEKITGYLIDETSKESYTYCPIHNITSWQNAYLESSLAIDLTEPINTVGTSLAAKNNFIYLTADSPTQSKPDFFVINIADSTNPQIVASLETGPGLKTIHLVWPFAFTGNASVANQLQLIDVSNPNNPFLKSAFRLPGSYSTADAQVTSVFYHQEKVYLGLRKSALAEFSIIDVSNKNSPELLGQFEFNTTVHDIFVRGGQAFVGTANDIELTVLDITNPTNIKIDGQFDAGGANGSGKTLAGWGTKMILGRAVGNQELYLLDITDPQNITELSRGDTNKTINKVLISGEVVSLATNDTSADWQAWQTTGDSLSQISSIDLPEKATGLACAENFIFTSMASSTAVAIIKLP